MNDHILNRPMQLRGNATTRDPRLDRVPQFDERSRNYPITSVLESHDLRSRWWGHRGLVLDQGSEGACVGFAWAHELNATPVAVNGLTDQFAIALYKRAQQIDEWPGENYSGTSVLAGAKSVAELGYMEEYRWAFGIQDVLATLSNHGPVVLGIDWYYQMYDPDPNRYIRPGGDLMGGHAILAIAYDHDLSDVWLLNSWGPSWGMNGLCRIKADDLGSLLRNGGEACVPVVRSDPDALPPKAQSDLWPFGGRQP